MFYIRSIKIKNRLSWFPCFVLRGNHFLGFRSVFHFVTAVWWPTFLSYQNFQIINTQTSSKYLQNFTSMISYCLKPYPLKTTFISLIHNIKVRFVHCKQHAKLTLQFEQRLLDFLAQHLLLSHRARYIHRTFLLHIKQQIYWCNTLFFWGLFQLLYRSEDVLQQNPSSYMLHCPNLFLSMPKNKYNPNCIYSAPTLIFLKDLTRKSSLNIFRRY